MNKKIIAFVILLCVLTCTILAFVIQKDFNSYKISFSIVNKDDALAYAKNDSEIKDFIDYWAAQGSEIIICEPYFYEDMNLWGVGFTPNNTYDLCMIIYFTPNGRIIYSGMGWGEEIGHRDIIENRLFGAWSGEISNLSCNKVTLDFFENGSVKINYTWFFSENRTEITWTKYFMLDPWNLWIFPGGKCWNFAISDDEKYMDITGDSPHLTLTKEENSVMFTVLGGSPYNVTVYDVSVPLNESEAIIIFETIMGYKPKKPFLSNVTYETEEGWVIQSGECLPIGGGGVIMSINQENRTVNVSTLFCI